MERRTANHQDSGPIDDSDMQDAHRFMMMPKAMLHVHDTIVSSGVVQSLGKDIPPCIAALLSALIASTPKDSRIWATHAGWQHHCKRC